MSLMTSNRYHLQLLGEPHVATHGGIAELSDKQVALLAVVLETPRQRVTRAKLASLLWPHSHQSSARHSLSQALYVINKKCPGLLDSDTTSIWAGEATCDVHRFREAVSKAEWDTAADLYRGPFLEGLNIPAALDFQHWSESAGQSLANLAERAVAGLLAMLEWNRLVRLTEILIRNGRLDTQIISARVTALCQTGAGLEANKFILGIPAEFRFDAQQMLEDLSIDCQQIATDQAVQPFVGRTNDIDLLTDLFQETLDGRPRMALITGEAGIGKTALAGRFQKLLAIRGARVLEATAHSPEQNIPFGVVEQWLKNVPARDLERLSGNPWLAVVQQVFPDIGDPDARLPGVELGDISHHRLLESLRRLVGDLGSIKPLALAVDNLQNADSASVGFLHYLFRKPPSVPILAVATLRDDIGRGPGKFAGWEAVEPIELNGLTPRDIVKWLQKIDIRSDEREEVASSLYLRTDGNPLLISSLLEEEAALEDANTPPQSIIDFYRPRILDRSQPAQRLLATISLLGESDSWGEIAEISGLTQTECAEAVRELESISWITTVDGAFVLKHSLLGQVAVSLISEIERKGLHGRAARVLGRAGDPPDALVAISHDLAGNSGDAFNAAMKAVDACDVLHARSEKEFFLKLALSNAPSPTAEAEVRILLGEHHLKQRRLQDAFETLHVSPAGDIQCEVRNRVEIMRLRVMAEMTGDPEVLVDYWNRARSLGQQLSATTVADSFAHIGGVAYDLGVDDLAAEAAELIVKQLSQLPREIRTALKMLRPTAVIGFLRGYEGALDRLSSLPDPDGRHAVYDATYHAVAGTLLVAAGDLVAAEQNFATSLGITERFALFDHLHVINNNLGVCLMEQGRYPEAEERLKEAIRYAAETSPSQYSTPHENLTILAYERSSYATALESGKALLADSEVPSGRAAMSLQAIIGLSALEIGDLAKCREAERELHVLNERYGGHSNDMSYVHIFLARMLASRKHHNEALTLLSTASRHYRKRNHLAFLRLEIERCKQLARNGVDSSEELEQVLDKLQDTGALPLVERASDLMVRLKGTN